VDTARDNLRKALKISEIQAQAILDMQLRRLAALERKKIEEEHDEKVKLITYLEGLLASPKQMRDVIAEELTQIKQAYNDPRRTVIVGSTASKVSASELLVPAEDTWVTMTVDGRMGRSFENIPPRVTAEVKEPPRFILESLSTHALYLVTADGQCATIPVHQLPQVNDPAEGAMFHDLCPLSSEDQVTTIVSLPPLLTTGYVFMVTERAEVKRLRLEDLPGLSANIFTVMDVEKDDRLGWVMVTNSNNEIMLATAQGQSIRFSENDVRPTTLPAGGMRGIKLSEENDRVVGAMLVEEGQYVWSITDDGIAKVSSIEEYPLQGRAGSGVIAMRLPKTSQEMAASTIGRLDDNIIVLTNRHKPLYMRLGRSPQIKRGRTGGDFVISMRENERVVAVVNYTARISDPEPETEYED
jgi:DNA gyrase subunit A